MSTEKPRRLWGGASELSDLLEAMPGGLDAAVRDFGLITLAGQLSNSFPRQLVFKGGFVLRHVHGLLRFSKDVDATRHEPSLHKLDGEEVAGAIRQASIRNIVRFAPDEPKTDSARSLDFERVAIIGETFPSSTVQVEVSYREAVIDIPEPALIGGPFYEDFEILTMAVPEMAAEKLRALAQRVRVTDLADLAEMLARDDVLDDDVARLAVPKFELVKQGVSNRADRISEHITEMGADYDIAVAALFPGARSYQESMEIVWPRIKALIP